MNDEKTSGANVIPVPEDMHAPCHAHGDNCQAEADEAEPRGSGLDRRTFLSACGCATLTLSSTGLAMLGRASKAEAAVSDMQLKIGHLPAGCVSHLLLAKARNMFADAGLNVEITQFNGPADNLQALVSGGIHAMHNPWTTTMAAYGKGTDNLRIVGGSGLAGIELVAREGSVGNVKQFIDAAGSGLKVGTLRLDTLELVAYGTMAQYGKTYDDYEMTFFPSMVGMGEALASGAVDVCTLAQPYAESVVKQANGVYLADNNDVWGPEAPDCVVTTTTEVLESDAELLTAYMKVLADAAKVFYDDFQGALDDLTPIYGAPREILEIALKRQSPDPIINPAGASGIRAGVKYLIDLGYFDTNIADDVLDLSYQPTGAA
jgi:NitT/TauT family transport system substrate-binding protein